MKKGFASNRVKCPYYRKEQVPVIYCKGVFENTYINLAFSQRNEYRQYIEHYCVCNFERCPIYQMLNENV